MISFTSKNRNSAVACSRIIDAYMSNRENRRIQGEDERGNGGR